MIQSERTAADAGLAGTSSVGHDAAAPEGGGRGNTGKEAPGAPAAPSCFSQWYATTFARRDDHAIKHEVTDFGTAHVDEASYHAWHMLAVEMGYHDDGVEGIRRMFREWTWLYTEKVRSDGERSREAVANCYDLETHHPDHPNNAGLGLSYRNAERVEQLRALGREDEADQVERWMR